MDLGALDDEGYFRLLQKLEGSGYTKDEDSVRVAELRAVAKVAAMATEALSEAVADRFLQTASSSLDFRERVLYLIQSAQLSTDARRARLVAFQQGASLTEARAQNALGTYVADFTGTTLRPTRAQLQAHRASPNGGLFVARREPAAGTAQQRRDATELLARGVPAHSIIGGTSTHDATWGDALEPAGIAVEPAVTIPAQTGARTSPFEVYPGSVVTREQWIELQSLLCWKSHGFSVFQGSQGRTLFLPEYVLGPGTDVLIAGPSHAGDTSFQNRIMSAYGLVGASSISDPTIATAAQNVWLPPSKTGPASGGYVHHLFDTQASPLDTGLTLQVDGSGNLKLSNTGGSSAYVTLIVRASPVYSPGSSTDTQPWIDADQMEHDDLAELYAGQIITDAASGQFAGVDAGGIRRVVYSGPLQYQGVGMPKSVILDTSVDWRNRWLLVVPSFNRDGVVGVGENSTFPVPSYDGTISPISDTGHSQVIAPRLFFTGPGAAPGSATQQPYQQPAGNSIGGSFWLFSDTAGALWLEMKEASLNVAGSWMALIVATETTDGSSVVTPVPVHATQVQTLDVEQPLHVGAYAQGRQGNVPRYLRTDPAPRAVPTCAPLGLISEGEMPPRPVSSLVRERLGATDDGTYEVRQPLYGQRQRLVSLVVPTGTSRQVDDFNLWDQTAPGVNDQVDMRDRILCVQGRWSTSDITIAQASPLSDVSAHPLFVIMYTGPFHKPGVSFGSPPTYQQGHRVTFATGLDVEFVFNRDGVQQGLHSVVRVNNASGVNVYLNLTVEVSPKLGLCDSRLYGTA